MSSTKVTEDHRQIQQEEQDMNNNMGDHSTSMGMQCNDHPYNKNNVPGGICAFCLQEKLGNLLSSPSSSFFNSVPFDNNIHASSSPPPSSSPPFRSNGHAVPTTIDSNPSLSLSMRPTSTTRRAMIPFLLAKKKKKLMISPSPSFSNRNCLSETIPCPGISTFTTTRDNVNSGKHVVYKRSKSTTTSTPSTKLSTSHFLYNRSGSRGEDFTNHTRTKNGFWSFLYYQSSSSKKSSSKDKCLMGSSSSSINVVIQKEEEEEEGKRSQISSQTPSFERKVSRSRSVGCGSRSFSGDFFERISNGFGDCTTLRRVESQREALQANNKVHHHNMKERVKCGGIFSGFIVSHNINNDFINSGNGKPLTAHGVGGGGGGFHRRSRSWSWALASPIRAFSSSKSASSKAGNKKKSAPNLASIP